MGQSVTILFAIFIPIVLGVYLLARPAYKSRVSMIATASVGFAITTVFSLVILIEGDLQLHLFSIGENMNIYFHVDDMSRVFGTIVTVVMPLVGIYAFEYMGHYKEEKRFFGFFLMVYGVLLALTYAGNLVTFYLFYELMSLSSVPLVFHFRSREAIMAGLKYLFYSLCGAYFVLFGIYFLNQYTTTLEFLPGGTLDMSKVAGNEG